MPTLRDVAERAGVSVSTVSLVLNGLEAGRVNADLCVVVRQAAEDLDYTPNLIARSLRSNRTHTVGLLSDEVASTPFAGKMLQGAQRAAWARGYLLMLIDTAGNTDMEKPAMRALAQRNMDAMIYAAMYHRPVTVPYRPSSTPFLILDGTPANGEDVDWVAPDEEMGAHGAASVLVKAGHRRIAFLNASEQIPASRERARGFKRALRDGGVDYDPRLYVRVDHGSVADTRRAARLLLTAPDRPTAIFCFNDRVALMLYTVALELGLSIPEDLSVVGFDNDTHLIDTALPGLTTVQLPHEEMGAWAVNRVLDRVADTENTLTTMGRRAPCVVIERSSVSKPPTLL